MAEKDIDVNIDDLGLEFDEFKVDYYKGAGAVGSGLYEEAQNYSDISIDLDTKVGDVYAYDPNRPLTDVADDGSLMPPLMESEGGIPADVMDSLARWLPFAPGGAMALQMMGVTDYQQQKQQQQQMTAQVVGRQIDAAVQAGDMEMVKELWLPIQQQFGSEGAVAIWNTAAANANALERTERDMAYGTRYENPDFQQGRSVGMDLVYMARQGAGMAVPGEWERSLPPLEEVVAGAPAAKSTTIPPEQMSPLATEGGEPQVAPTKRPPATPAPSTPSTQVIPARRGQSITLQATPRGLQAPPGKVPTDRETPYAAIITGNVQRDQFGNIVAYSQRRVTNLKAVYKANQAFYRNELGGTINPFTGKRYTLKEIDDIAMKQTIKDFGPIVIDPNQFEALQFTPEEKMDYGVNMVLRQLQQSVSGATNEQEMIGAFGQKMLQLGELTRDALPTLNDEQRRGVINEALTIAANRLVVQQMQSGASLEEARADVKETFGQYGYDLPGFNVPTLGDIKQTAPGAYTEGLLGGFNENTPLYRVQSYFDQMKSARTLEDFIRLGIDPNVVLEVATEMELDINENIPFGRRSEARERMNKIRLNDLEKVDPGLIRFVGDIGGSKYALARNTAVREAYTELYSKRVGDLTDDLQLELIALGFAADDKLSDIVAGEKGTQVLNALGFGDAAKLSSFSSDFQAFAQKNLGLLPDQYIDKDTAETISQLMLSSDGKTLSGEQVKEIVGSTTGLDLIEDIVLTMAESTGEDRAFWQTKINESGPMAAFLEFTEQSGFKTWSNEDRAKLAAKINLMMLVKYELGGKQLSDLEVKMFNDLLGTLKTDSARFAVTLMENRNYFLNKYKTNIEALDSAGYNVAKFRAPNGRFGKYLAAEEYTSLQDMNKWIKKKAGLSRAAGSDDPNDPNYVPTAPIDPNAPRTAR